MQVPVYKAARIKPRGTKSWFESPEWIAVNLLKTEKGGSIMYKSVYKIIELVGTSDTSWEEAARNAVEIASASLTDLRVVEITKLDMQIEDGQVVAYRARVNASFRYAPKEALDYRILAERE
jgi:flavin-binding protein dodecin